MSILDRFRRAPTNAMRETQWGPVDTYPNASVRGRDLPDMIGWAQPASFGQSYAGAQLHNGVSQLTDDWNVQVAGNLPYWQSQSRTNPPQAVRYGAPALAPVGPVQVFQMQNRTSRTKPIAATGIGTLYQPAPFGIPPLQGLGDSPR